MKRWIGLLAHALLGVLFPYAIGGAIVLLTGIDSPSGSADRAKGLAILAVYAALLAALNVATLRGLPRAAARRTAALHAAVWAAAAAVSFRM